MDYKITTYSEEETIELAQNIESEKFPNMVICLRGDLGSGTRSSLMYETIRIVGKLRPKYVMWENVKNLLSKKHKHNFDAYIETMNILGYNSYYQVLNAKDYGIPQKRERVYTISIRKDIDVGTFVFPEKKELKLRLKDMLDFLVQMSKAGVQILIESHSDHLFNGIRRNVIFNSQTFSGHISVFINTKVSTFTSFKCCSGNVTIFVYLKCSIGRLNIRCSDCSGIN